MLKTQTEQSEYWGVAEVTFTYGGAGYLLGVSDSPPFYGIWTVAERGGAPIETWPLDDVSLAVALGRLKALDSISAQLDTPRTLEWSPVPAKSSDSDPESATTTRTDAEAKPASEMTFAHVAPKVPTDRRKVSPTRTSSAAGMAVLIFLAGLLYLISLFVPYIDGAPAQFHTLGAVAQIIIGAIGIWLGAALIYFRGTFIMGVGLVVTATAVFDALAIFYAANILVYSADKGPGVFLVVAAAGVLTVSSIVLIKDMVRAGTFRFSGGSKVAPWIVALATSGIVIAIGEALPHRTVTVTFINGLPSKSATLPGGLSNPDWANVLEVVLLMVIAVSFPVISGLLNRAWLSVGVMIGVVTGFGASFAAIASQLGVVSPSSLYTPEQLSSAGIVTATISATPGFVIFGLGLALAAMYALVRGVALSRSADVPSPSH